MANTHRETRGFPRAGCLPENVLKVLANLSAEWLFKHVQTCKELGTGCEAEGKSLNRALP